MFIAVMMGGSLALGYLVTVAISLVLTFAVTLALPKFVEVQYRVTGRYKLVHEALWMVATIAGGYATALAVQGIYPQLTVAALACLLISMLWQNSWEARQRGMPHQILISTLTVVGVGLGYMLQRQAG